MIGGGPNGLAAAVTLAREGADVTLIEARDEVGGAASSAALTLPGFTHDVCSAVHPLAAASPFLASLPLAAHGLRWITPPSALAHPLDDGTAALLENSVEGTAAGLGADGRRYRRLAAPLAARFPELAAEVLAPLHVPRRPALFARFGLLAGWPADWTARALFREPKGRALFAGLAGHSVLPLESMASAAVAWILALAAASVGWPIPEGGSGRISAALASYFRFLGGRIVTGAEVRSLDEVGPADAILCDLTPAQLLRVAGKRLPGGYRRRLQAFRYGPGVFKLDWALRAPIPWAAPECARAGTVHLGGTLGEIAASERAPWAGRAPSRPFVLLAQPSLFDRTRAPAGAHTAWAYCHVPNGSSEDMTERIEAQVERFAPGFRRLILARSARGPAELERRNANLVGGDITGGAQDLAQLFLRPARGLYRTPVRGLYLCSASTPPGGGVHGMCGFHAARAALADASTRRLK
ncbi:MAG TPA: NAD(P)/FAD-dependent oxidoreductase [Elusimicrobiota bacterium]|nr:NAD(P)/FAD-dependent oxidoreductase [Elusimicrobiota bacterium]